MSKYFFDTEFLEGTQTKRFFGLPVGKTIPTIDLISIGIVCQNNGEYYAISKEFNLLEAWNRFDIKKSDSGNIEYKYYWFRENVLAKIYNQLVSFHINERFDEHFGCPVEDPRWLKFSYKNLKWLIQKYGKTNEEIADGIRSFVNHNSNHANPNISPKARPQVVFYGYYPAHDWTVFCWLYGNMINLPKGFPMRCNDIKQMLDEKVESLDWLYGRDCWSNSNRSIKTIGTGESQEKDRPATFEEKLKTIKELVEFPKEINAHDALGDAKWNKKLYEFLDSITFH